MTENGKSEPNAGATETRARAAKRPWRKPELVRIKAGSAEVGTRTAGDGAFTTS